MKKFEIVKTTAEISWKERDEIKEGCTMYDVDPEKIASFGTKEEAEKELKNTKRMFAHPEASSRSKSFRSRKTNMTKTASGSEAEIFGSLLQWKFSWSTKKRGKRSQKSKLTKRRRRPQKSMRAMRAPISCFTNKKRVVSKWHGFFICKKCTLYVKCIDIIRIMC